MVENDIFQCLVSDIFCALKNLPVGFSQKISDTPAMQKGLSKSLLLLGLLFLGPLYEAENGVQILSPLCRCFISPCNWRFSQAKQTPPKYSELA